MSASTASPIEEVTQNRAPNVATAHSMMSSAGASSSSAPQCETSSRSSSGDRPAVCVPRLFRALMVVAAVMRHLRWAAAGRSASARTRAGTRGSPSSRGERRPRRTRTRPRADAGPPRRSTGSGRARRARSRGTTHQGGLERLLAADQVLVGAQDPRRERLPVLAVSEVVGDQRADVVVEAGAGDLVGPQLAAEVRLQSGGAAEVHLEALDLLAVVHDQLALESD